MLFSDNTYILFGCRLLVCIENCMSLVKKTNVNSKNKQDPNPSRYILYKD